MFMFYDGVYTHRQTHRPSMITHASRTFFRANTVADELPLKLKASEFAH